MTTTAQRLGDDPRVMVARAALEESRATTAPHVEAARWWGRLEEVLAGVLDALNEEPPF